MNCGVGCRRGLDPELLWLWRRLAAIAPIGPLAWEPSYVERTAQEMAKRQKQKQKTKKTLCPALKGVARNLTVFKGQG